MTNRSQASNQGESPLPWDVGKKWEALTEAVTLQHTLVPECGTSQYTHLSRLLSNEFLQLLVTS